jgi:hypothetical protein
MARGIGEIFREAMTGAGGLRDAKVAVHGASAFFDVMDAFSNDAAQKLLVSVILPWATEVATHAAHKWNAIGFACSMCEHSGVGNASSAVTECISCHDPVCLRHAFVAHDGTAACWQCVRDGAKAKVGKTKKRRSGRRETPNDTHTGSPPPNPGGGFDQFKWAYAILNVDPSASNEAIRSAYKKACYDTHPDRAKSPQDARMRAEKFKLIQQAIETIKTQRGNL